MKRVAWRRVLPVVQLALFLTSLGAGCPYIRSILSTYFLHETSANGTEFYPEWIDGPPTALEQLGYGLSFPATITADTLSSVVIGHVPALARTGLYRELTRHALAAIAVCVFWYFIGWFIDWRTMLGYQPRSWWGRVLLAGVLVLCVECIIIAVLSFVLFEPATRLDFTLGRVFAVGWAITGVLIVRDVLVSSPLFHSGTNRS